jgi:hypothetical protein
MFIQLLLSLFSLVWSPSQVRVPGPGGGTVAIPLTVSLVVHTTGQAAYPNSVTTGAINTTGANVIVIFVDEVYGSPATPTDSLSNTWTKVPISAGYPQAWYCVNSNTGSSHTFTESTNNSSVSAALILGVIAFKLSGTASLDVAASVNAFGNLTTQPGSITPGFNGELLITMWGGSVLPTTLAVNSGFTLLDTATDGSISFGDAWQAQTTLAAINPTWSGWTNPDRMAPVILAFK